jgi:hypothetical protein
MRRVASKNTYRVGGHNDLHTTQQEGDHLWHKLV